MNPGSLEQKLTAIFYADVAEYSRLTGEDEFGTHRQLGAALDLVSDAIEDKGGRVVHYAGDAVLAEFPSVVAAVDCSVGIQRRLATESADVPEDKRLQFRIGVNLGEVIVDRDDIYGDGVNVAARLESLAQPGGVCVSGAVFVQVKDKLDVGFQDMGPQKVKNIAEPVLTYSVVLESAPRVPPPPPLPDKPSVAVLPFDNMSGDPEQEFFADGMAEDIITALSRMPWFFIIARNSTFTYKGRAVDVKQVARELGVQYVLEGSVRKGGSRLRITAQLIDAMTGKHVWAERYDREMTDIFAVQDEVTEAVVGAVAPEFLSVEAKRAERKDPGQLDAWECVVRGRAHLWKLGRDEVAEARKLFERAIQLVPSGEFGASDLAFAHFLEAYYRWSDSPQRSMEEMMRVAEKAVAVDDHDAWAQTMLGLAHAVAHRWDDAIPLVEHAIELNPNFAPAIGVRGFILSLVGEVDKAIESINYADRLSPRDSFMAFWIMGRVWANFIAGRYEEAVEAAQHAIQLAPNNPTYRRQLAASYAMLDRIDEAQAALHEYLRLEPNHTIADAKKVPTKITEHLDRFLEGLRKAGLPE